MILQENGKQVVVITGASSGIGRDTAIKLSQDPNNTIVMVARNRNKLEEVMNEIQGNGGSAMIVPMDITNEEQVATLAKHLEDTWGYINILFNNAGLGIFKAVSDMTSEEWNEMNNTMVYGTFIMTKYLIPLLINSEDTKHIIINSSYWGMRAGDLPLCAGYIAAKFAQRGFSLSLREELRVYGIKVTCLMPASVNTPFFDTNNWVHDPYSILDSEELANIIVDTINYQGNTVIEDIVVRSINLI